MNGHCSSTIYRMMAGMSQECFQAFNLCITNTIVMPIIGVIHINKEFTKKKIANILSFGVILNLTQS